METNINYTVVGGFVITLLALIILGIIWLSSGLSSTPFKIYKIYMNESVAGLTVESTVEFNGVTVGTVKSIEINHKDPHLVIVLISIKNSTPVTEGTRATLNTKGLTGITYVALVDQGKNLAPLQQAPGQDYPVIKTSPSFFFRLDTVMQKFSQDLTKITTSVEALLNNENLQSVREILTDIRHVTRTLAVNTESIQAILKNTAAASHQFLPLIQDSENSIRVLNSQILPAANQAMSSLHTITDNLSELSIELKENPAMIIRGRTPSPLGPGEK